MAWATQAPGSARASTTWKRTFSPTHPLGRFKAAFFRTLGYTQENWERLVQDLKEQHLVLDVKEVEETAFGRKYSI
ncbi:MAG: hypothetical protein QXO76_07985, partial [Thermoproteota archaeon]